MRNTFLPSQTHGRTLLFPPLFVFLPLLFCKQDSCASQRVSPLEAHVFLPLLPRQAHLCFPPFTVTRPGFSRSPRPEQALVSMPFLLPSCVARELPPSRKRVISREGPMTTVPSSRPTVYPTSPPSVAKYACSGSATSPLFLQELPPLFPFDQFCYPSELIPSSKNGAGVCSIRSWVLESWRFPPLHLELD